MNDNFLDFFFWNFKSWFQENLDVILFLSNNKYSDYLYRLECKREESTALCAQGNLSEIKRFIYGLVILNVAYFDL